MDLEKHRSIPNQEDIRKLTPYSPTISYYLELYSKGTVTWVGALQLMVVTLHDELMSEHFLNLLNQNILNEKAPVFLPRANEV